MLLEKEIRLKLDRLVNRYIERELSKSFSKDVQEELWFHILDLIEIIGEDKKVFGEEVREKLNKKY